MIFKILKRCLMVFIALWITVLSVFSSYKEARCAEIAIGLGVTIKGIITALTVSGVLKGVAVAGGVILGGIGLHELAQMDESDIQEFSTGLKDGFQDFVKEYEKNQLIQDNANMTEQEVISIATNKAVGIAKNFWDNAINVVDSTKSSLMLDSVNYWNKYSEIIEDMASRNLAESGGGSGSVTITPQSVISVPSYTGLNQSSNYTIMNNIGSNCIKIGNSWYCHTGQFYNGSVWGSNALNPYMAENDVAFVYYNTDDNLVTTWAVNTSTNIPYRVNQNLYGWTSNVNEVLNNTNIPIMHMSFNNVFQGNLSTFEDYISANWRTLFAVSTQGEEFTSTEQILKHIFENNGVGQLLNNGVRQMVNQNKKTMIQSGSIPIKKSSLRVYDIPESEVGAYTGSVGWDIPQVLDGSQVANPAFPRVTGETGVIAVPFPRVIPKEDSENEVVIPEDTPVEDTADPDPNPDEPEPEEPEPTIKDWVEENIGPFFPSGMDLTNIFPFCIPFDIYYMFSSLVVTPEAPVFEIPFEYPSQLKPYLGDSYTFTLDFSDFEVVARVLKVMLSLIFIFGLMRVTRSIIRG